MAIRGQTKTDEGGDAPKKKLICGVVMPISASTDYSESHWTEMLAIVRDAVSDAGLEANLVSNADESNFIHRTIVQNLYDNPIVVCDVSGKNPNVMFELGLRLAFDKPTIIIKDDRTGYSFDTGVIEHIPYPRDLRFSKMVDFKSKLTEKLRATCSKAGTDPNYSTFLKHFGKFTVAKLDEQELPGQEFVIEELRAIRRELGKLDQLPLKTSRQRPSVIRLPVDSLRPDDLLTLMELVRATPGVRGVSNAQQGDGHSYVDVVFDVSAPESLAVATRQLFEQFMTTKR